MEEYDLNPEQLEVLEALLSSRTKAEAAERLGVHRSTIFRRLERDEELKEAYNSTKAQAYKEAMGRLQFDAEAAAETLYLIMQDPRTPQYVRVQAAGRILDAARDFVEVEELERRIEELETA